MVTRPRSTDPGGWRRHARLAWWAVMAASVFWTLLYMAGREDPALPEFVYVNF